MRKHFWYEIWCDTHWHRIIKDDKCSSNFYFEPPVKLKPPDNLRNYHYLDTMKTLGYQLICLGNQIGHGEYLFYYQKKILKLIWWNFMRRNFMGFSMTSWKYLGQNYDRLHNKNSNNNNTGKKVYNRNSLGKSLFTIWATQKVSSERKQNQREHKNSIWQIKKTYIINAIQMNNRF